MLNKFNKYLFLWCLICTFFSEPAICFSQQLPIQPARVISFSTDEGSMMNVDVSPDGRTILFDLLGDLYTVASTGGHATQLTRGMALNSRPVWSPDGKRIAYISDGSGDYRLNVRNTTGSFHAVFGRLNESVDHLCNEIWTPDGNYVTAECLFLGDHVSRGGVIYGLAGGETFIPVRSRNLLRFSPDGKLLYYLDSGRVFHYDCFTKIKTPFSSVLNLHVSPDFGSDGSWNAALSPDTHWLAYVADSNGKTCLVTRNLLNGEERLLVASLYPQFPLYGERFMQHFSFSYDSKSLFIGYGGKIHRIEVETGTNRVIPFIADVKSDAGPFDYNSFRAVHDSVRVRYTRSANASPDGKQLVFSALNRLYVMNLPNGKAHVLVNQSLSQYQPVYSPDGKWIAYVSWCDTNGGYLWRVPASGGKPEQLTTIAGQYQRPTWSPDGSVIAVVKAVPKLLNRDSWGSGEIQLISVKGGGIRVIQDSIPLWNHLTFSADGRMIIYEPYYNGHDRSQGHLSSKLVSRNLDGGGQQVLAVGIRDWEETENIQHRTVSPNGRFFVYAMGEDLYLVPTCSLIQPTVLYDLTQPAAAYGQVGKQRLSVIQFAKGVDPFWEKGGKILSWSYGNKFYRVDPEKIVAAAQKKSALVPSDSNTKVAVSPDQVITMSVTVPKGTAHGIIALRNTRIITMRGTKVLEHGTIIIKDGRIICVGPTALVLIPKGAKVLDLAGTTVMPGFVDMHLHMHLPPDVFPQQSWMYLINLAYGVTTARDPKSTYDSYGYKELLESGQMIGPRLFSSGSAVPSGFMNVGTLDDARSIVSKRALMGGTLIKQYELPTRRQRQWLAVASREAKLDMTNEGGFDFMEQIGMMKDGSTGVEHAPHWPDLYKDLITFIARSGTYLTPTLQAGYPDLGMDKYENYLYWHEPDSKLRRFMPVPCLKEIVNTIPKDTTEAGLMYPTLTYARIRKQGGRVLLGSHGNNEGIGVHNELWALQSGGLTNMEALQAATILGAEGLGVQKDLGSLEVGKIADLIVLNKNPLDDIHNSREIRYVMKDGIFYDGDTLDEIWPEKKKCPEWCYTPQYGRGPIY